MSQWVINDKMIFKLGKEKIIIEQFLTFKQETAKTANQLVSIQYKSF